ncbi:uncharacterized protein LOC112090241 [Eutrema salsugineum]|uniref:uncharacterized protein LOC112090241 n=1 Tax=Eutrema salsugineum TaxID=72664 RepID=UPI000CED745A|nr:uncharacterized protein LOC112090241 [Eutrema salsugineum]
MPISWSEPSSEGPEEDMAWAYDDATYGIAEIYPKWATFVQSIPVPQDEKDKLFAQKQESVRKDVERAFGVLQARFAIVKNPALIWDKEKIGRIMRACIILHNMIVEDERNGYTLENIAEFVHGEGTRSSQVDVQYSTNTPTNIDNVIGIRNDVRDRETHYRLKADLVENIWQQFGGNDNYN